MFIHKSVAELEDCSTGIRVCEHGGTGVSKQHYLKRYGQGKLIESVHMQSRKSWNSKTMRCNVVTEESMRFRWRPANARKK